MKDDDDLGSVIAMLDELVAYVDARIDRGLIHISDQLGADLHDRIRHACVFWATLPTDGAMPPAVTIRALAVLLRRALASASAAGRGN